jgi:hypothetical protein
MTKTKIILDDLTDDEAWALARMAKRMIGDDSGGSRRRSERDDMDTAGLGSYRGSNPTSASALRSFIVPKSAFL